MKQHVILAALVFYAALHLQNTDLIMIALSIWSIR
ncbi:hypothetical protein C5L25_002269 [Secundilactobacillus silagei JCM 19001]|uniref:Uncharacterized protein n=1 Tax=Secundilactobacillus silagei JCM 19001 TaxID=1302250 RepID=A0A1Z5IFH2_9LACO|nr:hypothetical protein C5L25_002269 [Secundilactobacillus silagei JCM 19001]GAX00399.1 hypothetical protein IWT126_00414 [Secundilactobacillus silagei JCM 19001]